MFFKERLGRIQFVEQPVKVWVAILVGLGNDHILKNSAGVFPQPFEIQSYLTVRSFDQFSEPYLRFKLFQCRNTLGSQSGQPVSVLRVEREGGKPRARTALHFAKCTFPPLGGAGTQAIGALPAFCKELKLHKGRTDRIIRGVGRLAGRLDDGIWVLAHWSNVPFVGAEPYALGAMPDGMVYEPDELI